MKRLRMTLVFTGAAVGAGVGIYNVVQSDSGWLGVALGAVVGAWIADYVCRLAVSDA